MALNVKFLKGTRAAYDGLASKDNNTFYYISDESKLYLGTIDLSTAKELNAAVVRVTTNEEEIVKIKESLNALLGAEDGAGSIQDMIDKAIAPINSTIGELADLETEQRGSIVTAINEVVESVESAKTAAKITVTASTDDENFAKTYTIVQDEKTVGIIDIPKDMVVSGGSVVVDPEGQAAGTYLALTLANAEKDTLYINVGHLIDIYTAGENAAEVQLAISADNTITATLVDGGISTAKLANEIITTAKIKDGAVSRAKLESSVVSSLELAESAVQEVVTGATSGTIKVDGAEVAVAGLGSAAFVNTEDITEAAEAVKGELNAYKDEANSKINDLQSSVSAINDASTGILAQAKEAADKAADTALTSAKAYTDTVAVTAVAEGGENGKIAVTKNGVTEQVPVHGLTDAAFTTTATIYSAAKTTATEIAEAKAEAAAAEVQAAVDAINSETTGILAKAKTYTDNKVETAVEEVKQYADGKDIVIATGDTEGTIKVTKGTETPYSVRVNGLASAAFTESTAYDAAGSAGAAETNAKKYTDDAKAALEAALNEALTWGVIGATE